MTLSIELPAPLEEELAVEAEREGVTVSEQATLILYLAAALGKRGPETPFRNAVRSVLERHRIDPQQFSSAFEQLKKSCIEGQPDSASTVSTDQDCLDRSLRNWRDAVVHDPVGVVVEAPVDRSVTPIPRSERPSILGKYAHIKLSTEDIMAEKRLEIEREDRPR
jgi:hypothetical protein